MGWCLRFSSALDFGRWAANVQMLRKHFFFHSVTNNSQTAHSNHNTKRNKRGNYIVREITLFDELNENRQTVKTFWKSKKKQKIKKNIIPIVIVWCWWASARAHSQIDFVFASGSMDYFICYYYNYSFHWLMLLFEKSAFFLLLQSVNKIDADNRATKKQVWNKIYVIRWNLFLLKCKTATHKKSTEKLLYEL